MNATCVDIFYGSPFSRLSSLLLARAFQVGRETRFFRLARLSSDRSREKESRNEIPERVIKNCPEVYPNTTERAGQSFDFHCCFGSFCPSLCGLYAPRLNAASGLFSTVARTSASVRCCVARVCAGGIAALRFCFHRFVHFLTTGHSIFGMDCWG